MPSPQVADVESLVAPLPGDSPAGDSAVIYAFRDRYNQLTREENPEDYAPDDPTRPEKPKRADWPAVEALASQTLREQSKDLEVAVRLTEAWAHRYGFSGLREGLTLLSRLVCECWDRLNPPIEDGDVEVRLDRLANLLDDPVRGTRFPMLVRQLPVVGEGDAGVGHFHWDRARQQADGALQQRIDEALAAVPADVLKDRTEDIAQCLDLLQKLESALAEKAGQRAPSFVNLRQALMDARWLAEEFLRRRGEAPAEAPTAGETPGIAAASAGVRALGSRAELYRQLAVIADQLQQLEPHSPIPYLVKRAVQLGTLPFPQMIRELVRDESIIAELERQLGIKSDGS
ncbi:MAG: type VI secretion system protein TssA [Gemmataceae bacterium]